MKIKIYKKIALFSFAMGILLLITKPVEAALTDHGGGVITDNPDPTGPYTSIEFKNFLPSDIPGPPFGPVDGHKIYASIYEDEFETNFITCVADSRISPPLMSPGFCEEMKNSCYAGATEVDPSSPCFIALGKIYSKKLKTILQNEVDKLVTDAKLDPDKAGDIIGSCDGNPVCINSILDILIKEGGYTKDAPPADNSFNEALTPASLSDFLNASNGNQPDLGPINSADNDLGGLSGKMPGPTVDVTFVSAGAQPGSKMTATAVPGFFNNASNPKDLYFTWYLKRKNCVLSDNINDKNRDCDLDSNGKITENDWKISATKIIIAKSFDKANADYTTFPAGMDKDSSGYKAIPEIDTSDGWKNGFLRHGDNDELWKENEKGATNCYVQAPKSGRTYELRKVTSTFENECPAGYHRACVGDQKPGCAVSGATDPAVTIFNACTVTYEKKPNTFDALGKEIAGPDNTNANCAIKEIENFKTSVSCGDPSTLPLCIKDDNSNIELTDTARKVFAVVAGEINNDKMCSAVAKKDPDNAGFFLPNTEPRVEVITPGDDKCVSVQGVQGVQDALINGKKDEFGNILAAGNHGLEPKCGFEKEANLCKHLFPSFPKKVTVNGKEVDMRDEIPGDGEFTLKEKEFWGADPTRVSTTGNGKDEEIIVGHGVDKFEWLFLSGDQVGVAVEGVSTVASDHAESAENQRRWAFSNGKCEVLEKMEENSSVIKRGFYLDGSKGILTADTSETDFDLNECLEENLLDPDTDSNYKLSVQLNAMPENPINDPNGNGDVLNISSSAMNTKDSNGLLYEWSVQKSKDGSDMPSDTTSWKDVTSDMQIGGSFSDADLSGLDKKDLSISLNIKDPSEDMTSPASFKGTFYLRIKVNITGNKADGEQLAQGVLIVRVRSQENEMSVYPTTATSNGMLNLSKESLGDSLEYCSDQSGKATCYVSKNEILGLTIPSTSKSGDTRFSWTVNGNEFSCMIATSAECASGNNLFFPVLGNAGEAVDVVAKGIDTNKESIEVSRHFVIVEPQLKIRSINGNAWPKLLGYYKDLSNNGSCIEGGNGCSADLSSLVMETNEDSTVTLSTNSGTGLEWAIDGQIIPEYRDKNQIQLEIKKKAGESYNIGLSTYLLPSTMTERNNVRKALYNNWGISPEDAIEEDQGASMQLDVVANSGLAVATTKMGVFGASLITHLPEQLMFLLKLSLASIVMFLLTGLLFAFMPETLLRKER